MIREYGHYWGSLYFGVGRIFFQADFKSVLNNEKKFAPTSSNFSIELET